MKANTWYKISAYIKIDKEISDEGLDKRIALALYNIAPGTNMYALDIAVAENGGSETPPE